MLQSEIDRLKSEKTKIEIYDGVIEDGGVHMPSISASK